MSHVSYSFWNALEFRFLPLFPDRSLFSPLPLAGSESLIFCVISRRSDRIRFYTIWREIAGKVVSFSSMILLLWVNWIECAIPGGEDRDRGRGTDRDRLLHEFFPLPAFSLSGSERALSLRESASLLAIRPRGEVQLAFSSISTLMRRFRCYNLWIMWLVMQIWHVLIFYG